MPRPHILCSFPVNAMVKLAVEHSLKTSCLYKVSTLLFANKILKQVKVNHKHSYHMIKNNLQAKIKDKENLNKKYKHQTIWFS